MLVRNHRVSGDMYISRVSTLLLYMYVEIVCGILIQCAVFVVIVKISFIGEYDAARYCLERSSQLNITS